MSQDESGRSRDGHFFPETPQKVIRRSSGSLSPSNRTSSSMDPTLSPSSENRKSRRLPLGVQAAARLLVNGRNAHGRSRRGLSRLDLDDKKKNKIHFGDVVSIRSTHVAGGYLVAEGLHEDTVGVFTAFSPSRLASLSEEPDLSVRKYETWFRICPQLRYEMRKAAEKIEKDLSATQERKDYIADRVSKEDKENQTLLENCKRGHLLYGQVLQLQHFKSGKFLTMETKRVASVQKDCLSLVLSDHGTEYSWFEVVPRFKANNQGTVVSTFDQVVLQPIKNRTYNLSHSIDFLKHYVISEKCTGLSERKLWKEANLSVESKSWQFELKSHGDEFDSSKQVYLYDGQAISIFHPEIDGYLSCSISQQDKSVGLMEVEDDNSRVSSNSVWVVELVDDTGSSSIDPLGGRNGMAHEKSHNRGIVSWGDSIRLRHLYTGRYLSVSSKRDTSAKGDEITSKVEMTCFPNTNATVFSIMRVVAETHTKTADPLAQELDNMGDYVKLSNLSFNLEHQTIPDSNDVDTYMLYFHACTGEQAQSETGNVPAVFSSAKNDQDALFGRKVNDSDVREIETIKGWQMVLMEYASLAAHRFRDNEPQLGRHEVKMAASVLCNMLDCLNIEHGDEEDEATTEDGGTGVESIKGFDSMMDIDEESVKHDMVDPELAIANRIFYEPLNASKIEYQVRLSELRMFEVLYHVIVIPSLNLGENWQQQLRSVPLRWAYHIFRLCFRVITAIFQNNTKLELLFASSKINIPPREYADHFYTKPDSNGTPTELVMISAQFLSCGGSAANMVSQLVNNNETLLETTFGKEQVASLVGLIRQHGNRKRYLDLLASICTCDNIIDGSFKCITSNQELIVLEMFDNAPEQVLLETDVIMYRDPNEPGFLNEDILGASILFADDSSLRTSDIIVRWDAALAPNDYVAYGCRKLFRHKEKEWVALRELCTSTMNVAEKMTKYYAGLLSLFVKMAQGRSYNAIMYLDKRFSYELLVAAIHSTSLPPYIRSIFCELCEVLYVDRYPQTFITIPRPQFMCRFDGEETKNEGQIINDRHLFGKHRRLPKFYPNGINNVDFENIPEHLVQYMRITKPSKFDALHLALRTIFADFMEKGCPSTSSKFVAQAIRMSGILLNMGFYKKPQEVVDAMFTFLNILQLPAKVKRLKPAQMLMRQEICRFLHSITNFQIDLVSSNVLDCFMATPPEAKVVQLLYSVFQYKESEKWKFFNLVRPELTERGLDQIDTVLIKMVLRSSHVSDPRIHLFEKALELLISTYLSGTRLVETLDDMLIITNKADVRNFETIRDVASELLNDLQSYEIWGMDNEFSGLDQVIISRVQTSIHFLTLRCASHKDQLRALGVVDTIYLALKIDAVHSEHLAKIKSLAIRFLTEFVRDDSDYQPRAFAELKILTGFLEENQRSVVNCMGAIIKGNRKLCSKFPQKVIIRLINMGITIETLIFCCQLCSVNGIGIKRNQDIIVKAILGNQVPHSEILAGIAMLRNPNESNQDFCRVLVEFLSAATRGRNPYSEAKIQEMFSLEKTLECYFAADTNDYVLQCALLRFLADGYFDTGLLDSNRIQHSVEVQDLLDRLFTDLTNFEKRATASDYDDLGDTLSNFRACIFYGHLFCFRAFFSHSFVYQTAPSRILEIRESLLQAMQHLESVAKTPAESSLIRRAISAVRKSISGHLRKRKNSEERKQNYLANMAARKQKVTNAKQQRDMEHLLRSEKIQLGKPNQLSWRVFVSFLRKNPATKDSLAAQGKNLLQAILNATGSYDILIQFLSELMTHVIQKSRDHLLQFSHTDQLSDRTDRTACHVLTIACLILDNADFVVRHFGDVTDKPLDVAQTELSACGCVVVCFELFSVAVSEGLSRQVIETIIKLMEGGNRQVQDILYGLLKSPKGEFFFKRLEMWFQQIWEAAKLEMKLEKRRMNQIEAILAGDETDGGSVFSGNSSFLAESIDSRSHASRSLALSSLPASMEGGAVAVPADEQEEEDEDDCANMEDFVGIDELDEDTQDTQVNIIELFEYNTNSSRSKKKRKRSNDELSQKENAKEIVSVIRFLQLCMEGHNREMQDLLRCQNSIGHKTSVNFLLLAVKHIYCLTKNAKVLAHASRSTIRQIGAILDFLIESMQGPCFDNQAVLADPVHGVIEMIKKILFTDFELVDSLVLADRDLTSKKKNISVDKHDMHDAALVTSVKSKAIRVLNSMLEGRSDTEMIQLFVEEVDVSFLRNRLVILHKNLLSSGGMRTQDEKLLELLEDINASLISSAIDTLTIMTEMSRFDVDHHLNVFRCENDEEMAALKFFNSRIRSVEIVFGGSLHQVFFVKPPSLNFLSHSTRVKLFQNVDASEEHHTRIKTVLEHARRYLDEAEQTQKLAKYLPNPDIDILRSVAFLFSIVSNMLLLLSVSAQCPDSSGTFSPGEGLALYVVYTVSRLHALVSVSWLVLNLAIQCPITIMRMMRVLNAARVKDMEESLDTPVATSQTGVTPHSRISYDNVWRVEGTDNHVWYLVTGMFILISVLLFFRFGFALGEVYYAMVGWWVWLELVLFLRSIRNEGGKVFRNQNAAMYFCAVYDVVADVDMLFQAFCLKCVYHALVDPDALHLLVVPLFDIVLTSETLINVIRAVVVPIKSLTMTFILLAFTLYGFAFLTYSNLQQQVPDDSMLSCTSLLDCFLLIFDIGLRVGEGPKAVLTDPDADSFAFRYTFDLLFVVLISIFLLNIVFGIIIDTFGSLREQQHDREDLLSNYCFVCGLGRQDFDSLNAEYKRKQQNLNVSANDIQTGFSFHMSHEHNTYDYLGFMVYLERKDKTDYTGLESYVADELEKGEYVSWLPHHRALALRMDVAEEGDNEFDSLTRSIMNIFRAHTRHIRRIEMKVDEIASNSSNFTETNS